MSSLGEARYALFEEAAAVAHVLEEVERCAAGAQEDGVARLGHFGAGRYAVGHGVGVGNDDAVFGCQSVEGSVELGVVGAEVDDGAALLADERIERRVVVALVGAAHDEDDGRRHGVEGHLAGVDIRRLRVVDVVDAAFLARALEAVLNAGEGAKTLADRLGVDAGRNGGDGRRHAVAHVVFAGDGEFAERHVELYAVLGT